VAIQLVHQWKLDYTRRGSGNQIQGSYSAIF